VLFADEPTGNLDADTGAQIIDQLFGLNARAGTTLVMVTHDEALAARCDRVVRIDNGCLQEETTDKAPTQSEAFEGQA
ncbi:MAG: ABC transporter ATP-binding protein, partial [Oleiphilaceae bacterium]|nr:ABC transporter ATP-binding protein [Oleiphilaceae bacterium]